MSSIHVKITPAHPQHVTLNLVISKDISVPEAYLTSDFDQDAIRAQYSEAQKRYSASSSDNQTKAEAFVEVTTLAELGRALGMSL